MKVETIRADGCLGYVLSAGGEAALIDPSRATHPYHEALARDGSTARYVIDTHTHADHLSGARKLSDELGAKLVMSARHRDQWSAAEGQADALGIGDILRANGGVEVDVAVDDGATLALGGEEIRFMQAPGHTVDSLVVLSGDRAFTGDTLLIGQIGRCDLPGGDGAAMHETLFGRLKALDDATFIHPGHDYQGQTVTALGFERANNPFLKPRTSDEFVAYLKTAFPSLTGAGMQCGATTAGAAADGRPADPLRDEVAGFMDSYFFSAHRAENLIRVLDLKREIDSGKHLCVLDVREPSEFESGHIDGAHNLSVHQLDGLLSEVPAERHDEVVTICRSGKRSGWAAMFLRVAGYTNVRSVPGGMLEWQKEGLPVAF